MAQDMYPTVVRAAVRLGLFGISQVDAVSVLGTLNKDKPAVPDDWRALGLGEGPSDRHGERGTVLPGEGEDAKPGCSRYLCED